MPDLPGLEQLVAEPRLAIGRDVAAAVARAGAALLAHASDQPASSRSTRPRGASIERTVTVSGSPSRSRAAGVAADQRGALLVQVVVVAPHAAHRQEALATARRRRRGRSSRTRRSRSRRSPRPRTRAPSPPRRACARAGTRGRCRRRRAPARPPPARSRCSARRSRRGRRPAAPRPRRASRAARGGRPGRDSGGSAR